MKFAHFITITIFYLYFTIIIILFYDLFSKITIGVLYLIPALTQFLPKYSISIIYSTTCDHLYQYFMVVLSLIIIVGHYFCHLYYLKYYINHAHIF